jgi:hypothetical protein
MTECCAVRLSAYPNFFAKKISGPIARQSGQLGPVIENDCDRRELNPAREIGNLESYR